MKIEDLKAIAEIMREYGLSSIKVQEKDSVVEMIKNAPVVVSQAAAVEAAIPTESISTVQKEVADDDIITIKSPMVGVFYAAPSPDAAAFVETGSEVKAGDVLCIVEAMKLMNEVTAEQDGTIQEICVKNGDTVEYGTVLFLIGE